MSFTRIKIIEGDTAEIIEGKINHFLASKMVYAVERMFLYPLKEDEKFAGYYCYITYKEKINYNGESD